MKWLIVVAILSCSSVAYSECKIIEYPDHNEAVCDESKAKEAKEAISPDDKIKLFEKILGEQELLCKRRGNPEAIYSKLMEAENVFLDTKKACEQMGDPGQLDMMGAIVSAELARQCIEKTYLMAPYLASMNLLSAQSYAVSGNKQKAKQIYRNVIIRFIGDKYKSQVKQAEFGLEDLK